MKKIKFLYTIAVVLVVFTGCKYDDDYLRPTQLRPTVYFASSLSYERTVIPGEGLVFGIGPALGGVIDNKTDWSIDLQILKNYSFPSNRKLLPDNYYNSSELGGTIKVTIPKGEYMKFFYVKLDSARFLSDASTILGSTTLYALPVKIVGTSAEKINTDRDQVLVAVKYQAAYDGWYLHETSTVHGNTVNERSIGEGNPVTWRMTTRAPFSVRVAAPTAANANLGLQFDISVAAGSNSVVYGAQIDGQPLVEPIAGKPNTYDWKTRDFELNFRYKKEGDDTYYNVATKLTFRNRVIDGVNQPKHLIVF